MIASRNVLFWGNDQDLRLWPLSRGALECDEKPTERLESARVTRRFDDVVFACSPEVSTRLLTAGSSRLGFLEKRALRSVEYFDDVTVSHTDEEYMARHYELRPAGDGGCRGRSEPRCSARTTDWFRTSPW